MPAHHDSTRLGGHSGPPTALFPTANLSPQRKRWPRTCLWVSTQTKRHDKKRAGGGIQQRPLHAAESIPETFLNENCCALQRHVCSAAKYRAQSNMSGILLRYMDTRGLSSFLPSRCRTYIDDSERGQGSTYIARVFRQTLQQARTFRDLSTHLYAVHNGSSSGATTSLTLCPTAKFSPFFFRCPPKRLMIRTV